MLQLLVRYFLRGLLVVIPITLSLYLLYLAFTAIESVVDPTPWIGRRVPGMGVVVTIGAITLTGFLATNFATRWVFRSIHRVMSRLPLVKLLYGSLRDLTEAFVGDRKRFDTPVLVALQEAPGTSILGFLTRGDLSGLGLDDRVAVYVPQSYNFAGNLIVVSRERVTPVGLDGPTAMAFIVSGGVSGKLESAQSPAPAGAASSNSGANSP